MRVYPNFSTSNYSQNGNSLPVNDIPNQTNNSSSIQSATQQPNIPQYVQNYSVINNKYNNGQTNNYLQNANNQQLNNNHQIQSNTNFTSNINQSYNYNTYNNPTNSQPQPVQQTTYPPPNNNSSIPTTGSSYNTAYGSQFPPKHEAKMNNPPMQTSTIAAPHPGSSTQFHQGQYQTNLQTQQQQYQQQQQQQQHLAENSTNLVTSLTKPVQSRVDPSQIPRPVFGNIIDKDCCIYESDKYLLPPNSLAEPHSMLIDRGNATGKFYKLTLNQIPSQHSILQSMKLPCAAIIQPFPLLNDFENPVPIVNSSSTIEPIRCLRCRAYANPFTCVSQNGSQCLCNFCGHTFDIPMDYLRLLQSQIKTQSYQSPNDDQNNYPEIYHGVVDYFAPASLGVTTTPELPCYCFVIEASSMALQGNVTNLILYCLKHIFTQLAQSSPESNVTLILYSREILLFPYQNLNENSKPPIKMCVVSDIMEPFLPCPLSELCVPVAQGLEFLHELIDRIPSLIAPHSTPHNAYFSAVSLATQIFKARNSTGSIFSFVSSVPNIGFAAINTKETNVAPKSPPRKTSKGMKPSLGFVSGYLVHNIQQLDTMVQACREINVSLDTFIVTKIIQGDYSTGEQGQGLTSPNANAGSAFGANSVPTSTFAYLSQHTGGKLRLFTEFPFEKIYRDIYQTLYSIFFVQNVAYDCTFKLRCSRGIAVSKIYAPWTAGGPTPDLSAFQIPKLDSNTAIAFLLRHEENLEQRKNVFLQAACLYTCKDKRQRLLRVLTISIPVTTSITTAFRYASIEPIINIYARMAAHHIVSKGQRGFSGSSGSTSVSSTGAIAAATSVVPGLPFSTNKNSSSILTAWKQETLNSIIDMLFSYREHCANTSSTGQLILPDSLKLTLIYVSSLFKHPSLMPLNTVLEFTVSEQLVGLYELLYASVSFTTATLYPRLYPLHHSLILSESNNELQKLESVGLPYQLTFQNDSSINTGNNTNNMMGMNASNTSSFQSSDAPIISRYWLNHSIACSGERILSDGIYVLENGKEIYLYFGPQVDSKVISEIFGVTSINFENFTKLSFPPEDYLPTMESNIGISKRISNVVQQIRNDRFSVNCYMPVVIVSPVSQNIEAKFKAMLVEDAYGFETTYVDFLCNVHKLVQSKIVDS
ncbi:SEC24C-like component of COPII coatamer of ER-golgi vesicles [Cryptosporidium parvum Iowa II]|uniref:SEC24C-like component of COPII coatamer of ER-golgi vesicles n=1 Tax=Cryptosporidium parvum (strain Iowa II) TaxID=353152 RepID=Q5CW87_CRYPI|nr:SEC24C-like component of COPII coatamer of ER-golgi vesicles [Cryptosporidium parvum Iowa II]EAK89343.1 SEC24C-like component of COPII coatamer of ER-golgi vesicles [Cryptosporidium parvum Iowa II]WRK33873.1 Sec23/Sec24 [Cryptosporidium parvum]